MTTCKSKLPLRPVELESSTYIRTLHIKKEIDFLDKKGIEAIGYPTGHDETMSPEKSVSPEKKC